MGRDLPRGVAFFAVAFFAVAFFAGTIYLLIDSVRLAPSSHVARTHRRKSPNGGRLVSAS
jgi:hypothetical protein